MIANTSVAISADGEAVAAESAATTKAEPVDFRRDIQPVLREHCYDCHSSELQESGLRLDSRTGAFAEADSGKLAIVAGKPEESRLLELIRGDEPELLMPMGGDRLDQTQIELIRRWIEQGAVWPADADSQDKHWAFAAPERPHVPGVGQTDWAQNPIDTFVLARLEEEGLQPSAEADRYTLVRRVYLDLVGLPPSPAEADAFAKDPRPDAYERLVDRLLASPHYGERWARRWLDLARYSDTNGYEKDRPRSIWPYREWVIAALNADMSFDRFTIEQIAGDMLPDPTLAQQAATGFHRNTMINEEGGVDVEEFRFASIVDRVHTTGTVWLGLTISCAQCHSHKYDPISQREYYRFFALLNNADEPEIELPRADIEARRQGIEGQIANIQANFENTFPVPEGNDSRPIEVRRQENLESKFAEWKQQTRQKSVAWTTLRPRRVESRKNATLSVLDDGSVFASGDIPNNDTYVVELDSDLKGISALRLEVLPHESLPNGGPGRAVFDSGAGAKGDFLLSEIEVAIAENVSNSDVTDADYRDVRLQTGTQSHALEGRSAQQAIDGVLDTGWSIGKDTGREHQAVFLLEQPMGGEGRDRLRITLAQEYIHQMTIGRFRISATTADGSVVAAGVPSEIEALLVAAEDELTSEQQKKLRTYFLSVSPELAEQHQQIRKLRESMPEYPTTMVIEERPDEHARTTRIHHRGEYLKPTEAVEPGVPEVLPALPDEVPADRLALARWLVDEANPLTARVVMNRHWQAFFGRGLVETLENFGTQGAEPTHPELLDWLATEFVRRGWSIKAMHRLIVTSATYRQSSHADAGRFADDPDNRLLSRGPRFRMEAEIIRDNALASAGLLTRTLGGPSVFPPQPGGVTALSYGAFDWETDTGPDRYRRGLYTFSKRTAPYASFALFDAPSGETSCPRRSRSNTPLQSLTLLNDTVYLEAAQALARRTLAEAPSTTNDRIEYVFRRCLVRRPAPEEVAAVRKFYETQQQRLAAGELDAKSIAGLEADDDSHADNAIELAAWTLVSRAVLNLDETVTRE